VESGAEEIDLILAEASRLVYDALGNGSRWGAVIRYHQIPADANPYQAISALEMPEEDAPILLARGDVLPQLKRSEGLERKAPLFFCWMDGVLRWTGWGVLRNADLGMFHRSFNVNETFDRYRLESVMARSFPHTAIEEVPSPLLVGSYPDLIEAHLRVLQNQHTGLLLTGREIAPGIRVSRNVVIHRTAKLAGPTFIGENCRISEHCHIGPGASIGRDCLVENRTVIEDSVICPGSYIGEGLDLRQVYIDRGRLVNARLLAEIEGVDDLLLGSVYLPTGKLIKKAVSWIR
jgi:hypothetical protein